MQVYRRKRRERSGHASEIVLSKWWSRKIFSFSSLHLNFYPFFLSKTAMRNTLRTRMLLTEKTLRKKAEFFSLRLRLFAVIFC